MKSIFLDTSFFLQLRDSRELPWSEIADEEEIVLFVPRAVQEEIDRLKQDGNNRRSKRARKASSSLRDILQASNQMITVRESAPRVLLRFPPPLEPNRTKPASLDLSRSDDRIVEEALAYSRTHPSEPVFLLTNDTGPMLAAREHGLAFIPVPDEWMLAPEPDERDKSVQELRRRVDALEKACPVVEILASDSANPETSDLQMEVPAYVPFEEAGLTELLRAVSERCPLEEVNPPLGWEAAMRATETAAGRRFHPPTEEEVRIYSETTYPAWLKTVKTFLSNLPSRSQEKRSFELIFNLTNTGTVPALNALLEFESFAGVLLARPKDQRDAVKGQLMSIPRPPKAPSGHWTVYDASALDLASRFDRHPPAPLWPTERYVPEPKDRNAFFWKEYGAKPTKRLALECEEFRHQEAPRAFAIVVVLPEQGDVTSVIECRFSASNLPKPSLVTIPLRVKRCPTDPEPEARRMISELPRGRGRGAVVIEGQALDL